MQKATVGVIGAGNICSIYLQNLADFDGTEVVAIADLDQPKAQAKATEFGIERVPTPEELISDPSIEIVLDLTIPGAHFDVAEAALLAGKHVYNEKPLALTRPEGQRLMDLATPRGLRVGCAPDTILGAGNQTCRELIDAGEIGEVISAQAFMLCGGHEGWHPSPEFYYKPGGGPMFDMGPYYLSALINLLGPVRRVTGSTKTSFATRQISSKPLAGTIIDVEVPTHITAVLDFESGAIGQLTTSFDAFASDMPHIDIYGSLGTLRVPDPNGFGGPVLIRRIGDQAWSEVPVTRPYPDNMRGLGVLDMALAIRENRPHRASGDVAFHVLDIMHAVHEAADLGRHIELSQLPDRPAPMPKETLSE